MSFRCVECGCCCRSVRLHPDLVKFETADGSCMHLTADTKCAIYETRPDACRIDKAYQRDFPGVPREHYDQVTGIICLQLMKAFGAPREKRLEMVQLLLPQS